MNDRTEEATPKRQEDARKRGQVARSHDLVSALQLLALVVAAPAYVPWFFDRLSAAVREPLMHPRLPDLTPDQVGQMAFNAGNVFVMAALPVAGVALVLGLAGNVGQVGFVLTAKPLSPDFGRLDVFKGLGRLASMRTVVETGKTLLKMAIIGGMAYLVLDQQIAGLPAAVGGDLRGVMQITLGAAYSLVLRIGLAVCLLSGLDYLYQRWELQRSLRMSLQEVKDEHKQTEGDPKLKAQIRRRQRQISTRRMMAAVPAADVVITNPTHFAVAIVYQPAKMAAPRVVAKGQDLVAQRIKDLARASGVTLVENVALARALYASVEIGQDIPAQLYQAVAEVLAFVYRLKGRKLW